MDRSIFRNAAVERLSSAERLDQPVRLTTGLGWLALTALLLLVTAGCIASVVIFAPDKVPGDGVIISPVGILEVPLPSSGRLSETLPVTGERVTKGAVVARIEQPELRRSLEEARKAYEDLRAERQQVGEFQQQARLAQESADATRRRDLGRSHELIEQRLGYLHERAEIDTDLYAKHLITRGQVVDTKVATGSAEEELSATERQITETSLSETHTQILDKRELLALDLKIDAAQRQIALIDERLKQSELVVSPYSGTVVEYKHDVGELVQEGAALMTLLPTGSDTTQDPTIPDTALQVVLFVPNTEGKKIAPGMMAEITPSTVRREEYGFIIGRVKRVAAIPATGEGMLRVLKNQQLVNALSAGGAPFEVEIELLRDPNAPSGFQWSSAPGPTTTISPGTVTHGMVWIRRLRLIEFAVPALRRLFGNSG